MRSENKEKDCRNGLSIRKHIMISLVAVTVSLTVGVLLLVNIAHGYIDPEEYKRYTNEYNKILQYNALESLLNYCYDHADRPNPIQDLMNQGLLSTDLLVHNCKEVKQTFDTVDTELAGMIEALNKRIVEAQGYEMAEQYNCTTTKYWWCD